MYPSRLISGLGECPMIICTAVASHGVPIPTIIPRSITRRKHLFYWKLIPSWAQTKYLNHKRHLRASGCGSYFMTIGIGREKAWRSEECIAHRRLGQPKIQL